MIEIKSSYVLSEQTYTKQKAKELGVRKAGYDYLLILDNNFEEFEYMVNNFNA